MSRSFGKQPTPAKDTSMSTRDHAAARPADHGSLVAVRGLLRARTALAVVAATAGFAAATPASAATPAWGYEQLSPADGASIDIYGTQVSQDGSTVLAGTIGTPMLGMPTDGRSAYYRYGLPRGRAPWNLGPVNVLNGPQTFTYVEGFSPDGKKALFSAQFPSVDGEGGGLYRVDDQGGAVNMATGQSMAFALASTDFGALAYLSGSAPQAVYVSRPGQAPVQVSVDNDGNPMTATGLGAGYRTAVFGYLRMFATNAFAADGSSVIFTSTDGVPGDNDIANAENPSGPVGHKDLYRRILTPGHEETYAISDANASGDDDAGVSAEYRWATADHSRVFFTTPEALEPGDTDGQQDIYVREGKNAPVRVSQGETVDGSPTGNAADSGQQSDKTEWVMSSQDGDRTFFVTPERLTQDAPAGSGVKLYERDLAEGRTRFVAGPLDIQDLEAGSSSTPANGPLVPGALTDLPDPSFRGLRVTPTGAVFQAKAPLAGASDDGLRNVFVWTRAGGLEQINKPDSDAPGSPASDATILPYPLPGMDGNYTLMAIAGGRSVSDDGSQVLFSTGAALTAEDTDGRYRDIYVWSKGEGVRLVSPSGRAPYNASYVDSSPDGTQVWFSTAESILPSDTDPNAIDVYMAILGGGSPASPQVPDADPRVCVGAACQGPVVTVPPPSIGSVSFAGAGNVLAGPVPLVATVSVSKARAVAGSAATLKVRVPAAGRISVSGSSLRRAERSTSKAGSYSVKVELSARGKSTLRKKKTVKVRVRVTYRTQEGLMASKSLLMMFKQPKAKKSATSKKGGR